MAAQLVADGFLHLPGCLSSERNAELLRLTRWCMANPGGTAAGREPLRGGGPHEAMADLPPGSDPPPTPPSGGGCIQWHVNNAWNRNPELLQFLTVSPTVDIAEAVLGDDCRVIGTTNWVTGPGRPDGGLHNDYLPFSVPAQLLESGRVRMPVFIITAHCTSPPLPLNSEPLSPAPPLASALLTDYMEDMFEELGPTKFIRGSHVAGRRPAGANHYKGMPAQSLMVKAGDCVMFRCGPS